MTPACPSSWDDFPGLAHADEVMAAHGGQPTVAVQNKTHGAGTPAVDLGKPVGSVGS